MDVIKTILYINITFKQDVLIYHCSNFRYISKINKENKEDKINKGEQRSKNANFAFENRKELKRWVQIPIPNIPKPLKDGERDNNQIRKYNNNKRHWAQSRKQYV